MKNLIILLALIPGIAAAWAQKPDTATIMVHYKFSHVRDTNNRATPYTENMVLFVGKSAAAYRSYDRQVQNQLFKKQVQEQFANSPDGHFNISRHVTGTAAVYFQFPNEQKLVRQEEMFGTYIIDDQLPKLDWKITGDTASFGELHCQKATTHFKGRDYVAWFCPDLPVRVGPWKLNGLPGVIVDAHDAKNEVVFKFDGVEKVAYGSAAKKADQEPPPGVTDRRYMAIMEDLNEDPDLVQPPAKGTKTTESEFEHLKDILHKDPDAFARMLNAQQASDNPNEHHDQVRIGVRPEPVINNPIELQEK